MTAKVIPFQTFANPDHVLEMLKDEMQSVLILGWDKDGQFSAVATDNLTDGGDLLWLVEKFKQKLMNGEYEQ